MRPIAILHQMNIIFLWIHFLLTHDELDHLSVGVDRVTAYIIAKLMNSLLAYESILLHAIEILLQRISEHSDYVHSFEPKEPTKNIVK